MNVKATLCIWSIVAAAAHSVSALTITCQVVDTQAQPVVGAEVAVFERGERGGQFVIKYRAPLARTDARGVCRVEAEVTSHRDVFIAARKPGLALAWQGLNPARRESLCQGQIFLVMVEPEPIGGTVVDEQGRPVAHAQIQAQPEDIYLLSEWLSVETDTQGRFSFDCLGPDVQTSFRVQAPEKACTYIMTNHIFCGGFHTGETDIFLQLPKETPVTGTVLAQGTGRPARGVELVIASELSKETGCPCDYVSYTTISDARGRYTFPGVPIGPHTIRVVVPEDDMASWIGPPVSFTSQDNAPPTDINLTVQRGDTVRIRVFDAASHQAVEGASVELLQRNDDGYVIAVYRVCTREGGLAEIRVLPGRYHVTVRNTGYVRFPQQLLVTDGRTTSLECPLTRRGTMSGRVIDAQDHPASGVVVRLHPWGDEAFSGQDGAFTARCTENPSVVGSAAIARDTASNRVAYFDADDFGQYMTLKLGPGITLRGRVVSSAGGPVPAALLTLDMLFPGAISPLGIRTLTDANGTFEFPAMLPAPPRCRYLMSVEAPAYGRKHRIGIRIAGEGGTTVELDDIVLNPRETTVSGVVTKANGQPYARNVVFLYGDDQPRIAQLTNERGEFFFDGVCEGSLQIQADNASSPTGSGYTTAHGGDTGVKVVIGQERTHESYRTLTDRILPSLGRIAEGMPDVPDRPVLVGFWDMQQRPCRAMLTELAKHTSALEDAGVQVLLIHFARTYRDRAAYDRHRDEVRAYLQQNQIPFFADVMLGDQTEIRMDWGVKALPWLILTDSKHIVRAEGFTVEELDRKLEELEQD